MQASNAFRTHLMNQFASAARSQSRPPLVMMPWLAEDVKTSQKSTGKERAISTSCPNNSVLNLASNPNSNNASWASPVHAPLPHSPSRTPASNHQSHKPPRFLPSMSLSSVAEDTDGDNIEEQEPQKQTNSIHEQAMTIARRFQNLIMTRRTTSNFNTNNTSSQAFWKEALDRAAACAQRAPNHKRTEAFAFKRMLSPSEATERLADIAYQVTLQRSKSEAKAEKKRTKWSQIPAFLVAMVRSNDPLYKEEEEYSSDQYLPLDYVAPQTERELEDYAAACAAVQNVLLSLHAENIATKWATGPVIQTPAFRQLVGATPHDRIVALVMIGFPKSKDSGKTKPRRYKREGSDFLQDL